MGLASFVASKGYKNFMSKVYGWGAALVIMGALFKINHYTGADIMLIIGLTTEALIFFFSAFEPPHVERARSCSSAEYTKIAHNDGGAQATGPKKEQPGELLTENFANMPKEHTLARQIIECVGYRRRKMGRS